MIINFGGSLVPWATPAKAPIPISVNSSLSNTVTFISHFLPTSCANSAKREGVLTFGGLLAKFRASQTALAIVAPFLDASIQHLSTIVIFSR